MPLTVPRRSLALRHAAVAATIAFMLGACGSSAPSAPGGSAPTPRPTPTDVPGPGGPGGGIADPGSGSGSGSGSGGGSGGGGTIPGTGIPFPAGPDPNDPLVGQATFVTPTQGLVGLHAVSVQLVRAAVDADGHAIVELRWWSGVAPCSQLDSVTVERDDDARVARLTVIEGSGPGEVACIDIAQLKATVVDLGMLALGEWAISADGDAPAITLPMG